MSSNDNSFGGAATGNGVAAGGGGGGVPLWLNAFASSIGATKADGAAFGALKDAAEFNFTDDSDLHDAGRQLGMETELLQYENSMVSLTDPKYYAQERVKALKEIIEDVNAENLKVYKQMTATGQPKDQAKANALAAAERLRNIRMATFYIKFPQSANAIATTKIGQASALNNYSGSGVSVPPATGGKRGYKRASRRKK